MSDEELLETYRASVNKAMDEASARDGFATNMSRESIVAGLRAVFDMSNGEKRAEWEAERRAGDEATRRQIDGLASDYYEAIIRAERAEQGETEWEYGRVGHFVADGRDADDDAALIDRRTAEVNVRLSNEWEENHSPDVRIHYTLARRRSGTKAGPWLPVPDTTNNESEGKA